MEPCNTVSSWTKIRSILLIGAVALLGTGLSGCVSSGTHKQTLGELEKAQKAAAQEQVSNLQLQDQVNKLQEENQQINDLSAQVRLERDQLHTKAADLERKLETTRQDLANREEALRGAWARVGVLTQKEQDLTQAASANRSEIRELETKLEAEHAQAVTLREDKQRLLGGTTTAQSEITRLQKRAGELETEAARVKDMEKQVAEQNQEIGQLRHSLADRDGVIAVLASQGEELKKTKQRMDQLTAELATMSEESATFKRERDSLIGQVAKLDETSASLKKSQAEALTSLEVQKAELKRLEEEKAAKDAEIKRLSGTYEDLTASLRSEIAQGDIKIKQVRDRLTINVVDRILFDSGSAKIKPEGLKVMNSVGEVLKKVTDKQIRIDGHTDNVPISARLKDRFPSNWELSTSRATSVVRYLVDDAGVSPELLTAAGHADTQPVAANDTEEGRTKNRRIEIALYPKDLKDIANAIASER